MEVAEAGWTLEEIEADMDNIVCNLLWRRGC